jgi:hypothetical protein
MPLFFVSLCIRIIRSAQAIITLSFRGAAAVGKGSSSTSMRRDRSLVRGDSAQRPPPNCCSPPQGTPNTARLGSLWIINSDQIGPYSSLLWLSSKTRTQPLFFPPNLSPPCRTCNLVPADYAARTCSSFKSFRLPKLLLVVIVVVSHPCPRSHRQASIDVAKGKWCPCDVPGSREHLQDTVLGRLAKDVCSILPATVCHDPPLILQLRLLVSAVWRLLQEAATFLTALSFTMAEAAAAMATTATAQITVQTTTTTARQSTTFLQPVSLSGVPKGVARTLDLSVLRIHACPKNFPSSRATTGGC